MADFVLVDLDGTLTDPAPGIIGSFRHALVTLGHPAPPAEDLGWVIGPPLRRSFARQMGGAAQVEEAVALYREVYGAGGIFDATLYDGIIDALSTLRANGYRLYLCTAKPIVFARRITAHFGLDGLFDGQYGAELDGRFDDKGELIHHILAEEGLDATRGCMVGDRANDTSAAARNTMVSVGVLWGYGDSEELTANGASRLCAHPRDLAGCVSAVLGG